MGNPIFFAIYPAKISPKFPVGTVKRTFLPSRLREEYEEKQYTIYESNNGDKMEVLLVLGVAWLAWNHFIN